MKLIDQINESAIFSQSGYSADTATHDSLGNVIADTYISAVSASANISVTKEGNNKVWISGKDWTNDITAAANSAYTAATAQIPSTANLPYVENTALESNGILISSISGSGFYATSADHAFEADHANEADYVLSGWEYDENNRISAYDGSAFAGQGGQGIEYEGVAPIVVNNVEHKISAQSARLGVQEPLYFVEDSNTATVIGISGLPEVEGLMYESGLGLTGGLITSYNGSAFSADRAGYAVSATSANGAVSSLSANYVLSGWEKSDNKITAYNGTAFSAVGGGNPQVPVSGVGSVRISKPSDTVLISGKDFTNDITAASAYAYSQATAHAPEGDFIPYTGRINIGGYNLYALNSGIQVDSKSGLIELVARNSTYQNEAHIHLMQNMSGNKSFWSEIDGTTGTFLMFWNSATINTANAATYTANTTAKFQIQNGQIYYSATGGNEWYLNTTKYNHWEDTYNTVTSNSASWGGGGSFPASADQACKVVTANSANWGNIRTEVVGSTAQATGSNILYIVTGS